MTDEAKAPDDPALNSPGQLHEARARYAESASRPTPSPKGLDRMPMFAHGERPAFVYFVVAENGLVKIGKADDPGQRFVELCRYSPVTLKLLKSIFLPTNARRLELFLHLRFIKLHSHAEWFALGDAELEFIQDERAVLEAYAGQKRRQKRLHREFRDRLAAWKIKVQSEVRQCG